MYNLRWHTFSVGFDYDPFGMITYGRSWSVGSDYRYGFNGKESDSETYGGGNIYDYGFRIYDPRLGKFLSADPLTKSYAWYTPYQFAGNTPIQAIDLDGLEEFIIHYTTFENSKGESIVYRVNHRYLTPNERGNLSPSTFFIDNSSDATSIITTKYEKEFLRNNSLTRGVGSLNDNQNEAYDRTRNQFIKDGGVLGQTIKQYGSDILQLNATINFEDDQGMTGNEVNDAFTHSSAEIQATIDNIVGALINDPKATISIEGLASPKATSLKGTITSLDTRNNEILAAQRATSARDFFIQYALEKYDTILSAEKFIVTSRISNSDSSGLLTSDLPEDRAVNITLNNTK